jgi:hypothetical protein
MNERSLWTDSEGTCDPAEKFFAAQFAVENCPCAVHDIMA